MKGLVWPAFVGISVAAFMFLLEYGIFAEWPEYFDLASDALLPSLLRALVSMVLSLLMFGVIILVVIKQAVIKRHFLRARRWVHNRL